MPRAFGLVNDTCYENVEFLAFQKGPPSPEHSKMNESKMEHPKFAETSTDAWQRKRTFKMKLRAQAKSTALWMASKRFKPSRKPVIRCFYSHAVFPDCHRTFYDWIRRMKRRGKFVTTSELLELMSVHEEGNYFHLSFDDAFANVFEIACDVLADAHVPATIFVPVDYVEATHSELVQNFRERHSGSAPVRIGSWKHIYEAVAAGFEIGSHTNSHARLSTISRHQERLHEEVVLSRQLLERRLGVPCTSFAWPYGTMKDIDDTAAKSIQHAGYEAVFSAIRGRVQPNRTDQFCIPRHQIEFHWPKNQIELWSQGFGER